MLKRILVPLDSGADSSAAGTVAIEMAKRHKAFITAMAVVDRPGIARAIAPMGIGTSHLAANARDWLLAEGERGAEKALMDFGRRLADAGVPNTEVEEFAGPVEAIVDESRFYDLVVMGRRQAFEPDTTPDTDTLRAVIKEATAPVIAASAPAGLVRNVVICFDGSPQAARTLKTYARQSPFGHELATTVLAVEENSDDREQMPLLVDRAANVLQAYGHRPFIKILSGKPHKVVPAFLQDNEVDLAVLGAFGRGGLRSLFFGGLTEHLIEQGDVSLYLSH